MFNQKPNKSVNNRPTIKLLGWTSLTLGLLQRRLSAYEGSLMSSDSYKIASMPKLRKILGLLARPNAPMVMANFLQFREQANSKRFSGMTGKEAYSVYGESAMKAQSSMGSRIIWASEKVEKVAGLEAPNFDVIVLLEYASPKSFLKFAVFGDYDSKARSAGLKGQWLLASTTLEEGSKSSLNGVALVEIFSVKAGRKNQNKNWLASWQDVKRAHGGETIWVGSADSQPIGYSAKTPNKIIVTQFPDVESMQNALSTEEALALKNLSVKGLEDYLAYRACPSDNWQDMLSEGSQ